MVVTVKKLYGCEKTAHRGSHVEMFEAIYWAVFEPELNRVLIAEGCNQECSWTQPSAMGTTHENEPSQFPERRRLSPNFDQTTLWTFLMVSRPKTSSFVFLFWEQRHVSLTAHFHFCFCFFSQPKLGRLWRKVQRKRSSILNRAPIPVVVTSCFCF